METAEHLGSRPISGANWKLKTFLLLQYSIRHEDDKFAIFGLETSEVFMASTVAIAELLDKL